MELGRRRPAIGALFELGALSWCATSGSVAARAREDRQDEEADLREAPSAERRSCRAGTADEVNVATAGGAAEAIKEALRIVVDNNLIWCACRSLAAEDEHRAVVPWPMRCGQRRFDACAAHQDRGAARLGSEAERTRIPALEGELHGAPSAVVMYPSRLVHIRVVTSSRFAALGILEPVGGLGEVALGER